MSAREKRAAPIAATRGTISLEENGHYTASYNVTRSGSYAMQVSHDNVSIDGSPFTVVVDPAPTHVLNCTRAHSAAAASDADVDSLPLPPALAGSPSQFELIARDFFGNLRLGGGDQFEVALAGA